MAKKSRLTDLRMGIAAACVGALTWMFYRIGKCQGASDAYEDCGSMLTEAIKEVEKASDESISD